MAMDASIAAIWITRFIDVRLVSRLNKRSPRHSTLLRVERNENDLGIGLHSNNLTSSRGVSVHKLHYQICTLLRLRSRRLPVIRARSVSAILPNRRAPH
jgi:hypothetical protein